MENRKHEELTYHPQKDGVTQSMIHTWRGCPVKARMTLKGYKKPASSTAVIFGSVFHEAIAEVYSQIKNNIIQSAEDYNNDHKVSLTRFITKFFEAEYDSQTVPGKEQFDFSFQVVPGLIYEYLKFWKEDFGFEYLAIEENFKTEGPCLIPLRGKRDAVLKGVFNGGDRYLMEHKTKSQISEGNLGMTISRDLQNLLYIYTYNLEHSKNQLSGVLYNIIRKPMLRKKANESMPEFGTRCLLDIQQRPEHYFMRFDVPITPKVINNFSVKFASEMMRYLTWWETNEKYDQENTANCYMYNSPCQFIEYCDSNYQDTALLEIKPKHFSEL